MSDNRAAVKRRWQVIVGNVGTVYDGDHRPTAIATYVAYRSASRTGVGRGAGEPVTVLRDDEVFREWQPKEIDNG